MSLSEWTGSAANALRNAGAYASDFMRPVVRLGVTGLARSGKTVFITSLIHNLINSGRLPFFAPYAEGRIIRAYLEPQPDDDVPRFAYEEHLARLTGSEPSWPESTKRISQLRLTIDYEPAGLLGRTIGPSRLSIDIVDYPGEWILDLALLGLSYDDWCRQTLASIGNDHLSKSAGHWKRYISNLDPNGPQDEAVVQQAAALFTSYLQEYRDSEAGLPCVLPGRFLMPGDLKGSPMLTFFPIIPPDKSGINDTLWGMMNRRFEAYKSHVVKPFFRDHFAKLDRQIVLVDALQGLNGGPAAMQNLRSVLTDVLKCFRPGKRSWLGRILGKRIDRILFAATKADHIHHVDHDHLQAILAGLTREAIERAEFSGAQVKVLAMAALRATREAEARQAGETLPCIQGFPLPGEHFGTQSFDGSAPVAIFPGDLPLDVEAVFGGNGEVTTASEEEMHFVRFRPPVPEDGFGASGHALPHVRLDRALQFLLGDRLS